MNIRHLVEVSTTPHGAFLIFDGKIVVPEITEYESAMSADDIVAKLTGRRMRNGTNHLVAIGSSDPPNPNGLTWLLNGVTTRSVHILLASAEDQKLYPLSLTTAELMQDGVIPFAMLDNRDWVKRLVQSRLDNVYAEGAGGSFSPIPSRGYSFAIFQTTVIDSEFVD